MPSIAAISQISTPLREPGIFLFTLHRPHLLISLCTLELFQRPVWLDLFSLFQRQKPCMWISFEAVNPYPSLTHESQLHWTNRNSAMRLVCSQIIRQQWRIRLGLKDRQQEHTERGMRVGKNKTAPMREKWKMRACGDCLSMDCLDNSRSVSLPSWGWATGRVLHHIMLHNSNWRRSHLRREKREDIVHGFLSRRLEQTCWGREGRWYLDFFKLASMGGQPGISFNKAPCQPEMHCRDWQAIKDIPEQECDVLRCLFGLPTAILKEISWKMKSRDNPIKGRPWAGAAVPLSLPLSPTGKSSLRFQRFLV